MVPLMNALGGRETEAEGFTFGLDRCKIGYADSNGGIDGRGFWSRAKPGCGILVVLIEIKDRLNSYSLFTVDPFQPFTKQSQYQVYQSA